MKLALSETPKTGFLAVLLQKSSGDLLAMDDSSDLLDEELEMKSITKLLVKTSCQIVSITEIDVSTDDLKFILNWFYWM